MEVRSSAASRIQTVLAGLVTVAVVAVIAVVVLFSPQESPPECRSWTAEQRENAATVIRAGQDLGLSERDQTIAVMTAMGESSLRNLDYGDWETSGVRNPDGSPTTSVGLFQQQDEWGPRDARMDPYTAATMFYRAMLAEVPEPERLAMEPTLVAHRTQINAQPDHYAPYWPAAVALAAELAGGERAPAGTDAAGSGGC